MQPLPGTDTSLILGVKSHAKLEIAVNSEEWWRQQVTKIKPDEVFFHRYFVAKEESEVKAFGKKRKRGTGEEDEMDEDEIFDALVKSSKEEGGLGDVDVDGEDSVEWSDEDLDVEEMNEGPGDMEDEDDEDMDQDVDDEMSGEEGDVNDFFDDEAEEVEDDDEEIQEISDEEVEEVSDEEVPAEDSDESDGVDGRFEFGDSASDIMDSDEDIPVPIQQTNADRSKKRKLIENGIDPFDSHDGHGCQVNRSLRRKSEFPARSKACRKPCRKARGFDYN